MITAGARPRPAVQCTYTLQAHSLGLHMHVHVVDVAINSSYRVNLDPAIQFDTRQAKSP